MERWSPYILNFFDNRTTNAFAEGIHTKIKMIKRVSFGFRNVDIYIRKMLLCILPLAVLLPWLPHQSSESLAAKTAPEGPIVMTDHDQPLVENVNGGGRP